MLLNASITPAVKLIDLAGKTVATANEPNTNTTTIIAVAKNTAFGYSALSNKRTGYSLHSILFYAFLSERVSKE